ncbi:MAG: hypothetical protein EXR75_15915 [Myxococcales bacterium]|nr:hypothetical protein [Myxococcales bacterium]
MTELRVSEIVRSHPGFVASAIALGGVLVLTSSAVVLSLLHLPWLLFAVPGIVGVALLVAAVVMLSRLQQASARADLEGRKSTQGHSDTTPM